MGELAMYSQQGPFTFLGGMLMIRHKAGEKTEL